MNSFKSTIPKGMILIKKGYKLITPLCLTAFLMLFSLLFMLTGCAPGKSSSSSADNTLSSEASYSESSSSPGPDATASVPAESVAPDSSSASSPSSKSSSTVTVVIDASAAGGGTWSYTGSYHSGDSVFTILKRLNDSQSIQLSYESSPVYVNSIKGYSSGMSGASSGWLYSVNGGDPPGVACDEYADFTAGDSILWRFTLDWK